MISKGYKSALETTGCFKEVCEKVCVYVCTENPLSLCFSISFLGKSDYLNPIMHSSPLFFLSPCIPLLPVNQKKVVSQAIVEGEVPCFLESPLLRGTPKLECTCLMKFLTCFSYTGCNI